MQSEQQRHQYLAALGVASWLPRVQMPAAQESSDWAWSFVYDQNSPETLYEGFEETPLESADAVERSVAPVSAETLNLVPSKPPLPKLGGDDIGSKQDPSSQETPSQADRMPSIDIIQRTAVEKAPRFCLGFWLFNEVLVVDTLPPQSRGNISDASYQALCTNMLRAMGYAADLQFDYYTLAWPMLAGETLNQSKDEALIAVHHKLAKLLDGVTPSLILMLGESAAQMIMKRDESIEEMRGLVFSYTSQIRAISTHSLTQMMQIPECKKEVWKDLQKVLKPHD